MEIVTITGPNSGKSFATSQYVDGVEVRLVNGCEPHDIYYSKTVMSDRHASNQRPYKVNNSRFATLKAAVAAVLKNRVPAAV